MSKLDDIVISTLSNANINNDAAKEHYKQQVKDLILELIDQQLLDRQYFENEKHLIDPTDLRQKVEQL